MFTININLIKTLFFFLGKLENKSINHCFCFDTFKFTYIYKLLFCVQKHALMSIHYV